MVVPSTVISPLGACWHWNSRLMAPPWRLENLPSSHSTVVGVAMRWTGKYCNQRRYSPGQYCYIPSVSCFECVRRIPSTWRISCWAKSYFFFTSVVGWGSRVFATHSVSTNRCGWIPCGMFFSIYILYRWLKLTEPSSGRTERNS